MLAVLKACIIASNDITKYLEIMYSGAKTANFMARQLCYISHVLSELQ